MNKMINAFLLTGDIFMPKMHLRQPGFTYSANVYFSKNGKTNEKNFKNERFKIYLLKRAR